MRGGAGGRGQRVGGRSQGHGQMKKPHHLTYNVCDKCDNEQYMYDNNDT